MAGLSALDGAAGAIVGVGVDVVEVERIRLALSRTPELVARVYTDTERTYCEARRDPTERYAARFAAKEAVLKALGVGIFRFPLTDIEVRRADSGAPSIALAGDAAAIAADAGVDVWHVTLTHTATTAMAVAVAVGPTGGR